VEYLVNVVKKRTQEREPALVLDRGGHAESRAEHHAASSSSHAASSAQASSASTSHDHPDKSAASEHTVSYFFPRFVVLCVHHVQMCGKTVAPFMMLPTGIQALKNQLFVHKEYMAR
jgi:hypothetical protein